MVKEGYWYGFPLLLASGALLALRLWIPAVFFLVVAGLVLNFFRDPERPIPQDPEAVVSPADGHVVEIKREPFEGRPAERISIFMSPLDVHVNRAPAAGTIRKVSYHPGAFKVASRPDASVENEYNLFTLESERGMLHVKQIAGAVARRIVFWKQPGDVLARGDRVGLIKFGSRVDLLVEPQVEWRVQVGDYVRAGSTILGFFKT